MLFSYADKNTPYVLSPESLDWYLGKGWYRMGGHIFTTHFLFFQEQPFSAIWIRQDLKNFRFSKSQRKLMRRNAKLFDIAYGPRVIDEERDELYGRYAENFDGRLSPTIADSLEDYDGGTTIFNTWETTVRDKVSGKLVASSYFDLGNDAAASILGIYDPLLDSFSLGYYTMLLEMRYCLDNDIRHYYPGYVVPGYQRFDYKLRLGPSEFYDLRTESWIPFDREDIDRNGPTERQKRELTALSDQIRAAGVESHGLVIYPLFEAGLYDIWDENFVPYPYFFPLGKDETGLLLIVIYDPKEQEFLLLQCLKTEEAPLMFNATHMAINTEGNYFTDLISVHAILFRTSSLDIMSRASLALLTGSAD